MQNLVFSHCHGTWAPQHMQGHDKAETLTDNRRPNSGSRLATSRLILNLNEVMLVFVSPTRQCSFSRSLACPAEDTSRPKPLHDISPQHHGNRHESFFLSWLEDH